MSGNKNFRVIINLSNFYPDHRSKARIFINDEMKTIKDVERKIKQIFDIKNFHLTSQNEFLPSSEDVRIIQKDDLIWVMPNEGHYKCSHFGTLFEQHKKCKETSRKRLITPITNIEEEIQDEELQSPKKKKKKKVENVEHMKDTTENESILKEKQKKKKKKIFDENDKLKLKKDNASKEKKEGNKQHENLEEIVEKRSDNISNVTKKNGFMNINTLLPVLQSHINSYNQKLNLNKSDTLSSIPSERDVADKTVVKSKNVEKTDHKQSYLGNLSLSSYKKNVPLPTITDKYLAKKKVNIVKIEYLTGDPKQIAKLEKQSKVDNVSSGSNCKDLLENIEENSLKTLDTNSSVLNSLEQSTFAMDDNVLVCSAKKDQTELEKTDPELMDIDGETENRDLHTECPLITSVTTSSTECQNENVNRVFYDTSILDSNVNVCHSGKEIIHETQPKSQNNSLIKNIRIHQISLLKKSLNKEVPVKDTEQIQSSDLDINTNNESKNFVKLLPQEKTISEKEKLSLDHNNFTNFETEEKELDANDIVVLPNTVNTSVNIGMDFSNMSNSIHMVDNISECNGKSPDANVSETNIALTNDIDNEGMLSNIITDVSTEVTSILPKNTENLDNTRNNLATNSSTNLDVADNSKFNSDNSSIFFKRKQQLGVGQVLQGLRSSESAISVESLESDCSEFVTKRQRKRVRKRKKKNVNHDNTSLNESSILYENYVPKPLKIKACPAIHIKFEEESENNMKIIDLKKDSELKPETETAAITISETEDSKIEKIHVEESDIVKSPSMKKLLPRLGDIIAFKRLRISENYTPEISSYITGKVVGFDSETKKVIYEILSGLDQCDEPKGKLSIGFDAENKDINNRLELAWIEVIDPRLLFP